MKENEVRQIRLPGHIFIVTIAAILTAGMVIVGLWYRSNQRQADPTPQNVNLLSTSLHLKKDPVLIKGAGLSGTADFGRPILPLHFIENVGQTDPTVRYLAAGVRQTLFFTPSGIVFSARRRLEGHTLLAPDVRLVFIDANSETTIDGLDRLPGKANYVGTGENGLSEKQAGMFGAVVYRDLYPGIDLYYFGDEGQLKNEFRVAQGIDPDCIRMSYEGAEDVFIRADGSLVIRTILGELIEDAPVIYQIINGQRIDIRGHYRLLKNKNVGFIIDSYDGDHPLVIDPQVTYSTFFGGSNEDDGLYVAVDVAGNAYFVGTTASADFPVTPGAAQSLFLGGPKNVDRGFGEAFATKINATGDATVYSTFLGGGLDDVALGVAVDNAGNAYIAGFTMSPDFPTTPGTFQPLFPGGTENGFVVKLGPDGTLVHSTYLGTPDADAAFGITVDGNGRAYIAGGTSSNAFPVTPGVVQPAFGGGGAQYTSDAFVAILNNTFSALDYATYLGGTEDEGAFGIALDPAGNIHVTGVTLSGDFPLFNPVPNSGPRGDWDLFATKLTPAGDAFVHSNVLGGSIDDHQLGVAADANGNTIIIGWTDGADYPTTPTSWQPASAGNRDLIVSKIEANGNNLVFSTFLGTPGWDEGYSSGIGLLSDGSIVIAGHTDDPTLPTTPDAFQAVHGGGFADGILVVLNPAGDNIVYSTYIGGGGTDGPSSIGVNENDRVCISGWTNSGNYPTVDPIFGVNNNPLVNQWFGGDSFLTCFDFGTTEADLALTKADDPDPVIVGNMLTYTLTVTNFGPDDATGVTITDTLPTSTDFDSASPGCAENNGTVTCDIGGLANGAQATVDITVDTNTAGTITNTAVVAAIETDPDGSNNTVTETTTVDPLADLAVTKTENQDPVAQGSNLTYTLNVTNSGPSSASGVTLTDDLPDEVIFVSTGPGCTEAGGIVTCDIGALAVGGQVGFDVVVTVNSTGTIDNVANVVGAEADPDDANNTAVETTTVTAVADLAVSISDDPDPVQVEEELTFTVTLSNLGPAAATNAVVTNVLPSGVTFQSASDGCQVNDGTVTCLQETIASGTSVDIELVVTPNATPDKITLDKTITNTVTVAADEADPDPTNNTATTTTQVNEVSDLAVTKTDSDDPIGTNSSLTYTLAVTNNGPSQATGVILVDTLPDDVTFVPTDNQSCAENSGVVTCNVGTLNSGQSAVVEIVVTTPGTAATITNSAGVSGNETDPDTGNNAVSEDTEVEEVPVLARIEVSPSSVDLNVSQTQQFTAAGFDQFDQDFAISPTWTANGGTIETDGLYTAGDASGSYTVTATDAATGIQGTANVTILSGVAVEDETVPMEFVLHSNYPNPFNVRTTLSFDVKESVHVRLMVYNMLGHEVSVLADRAYAPGRHQVPFEANWLPSGVYLYRIEMGDFQDEKTMLLLK